MKKIHFRCVVTLLLLLLAQLSFSQKIDEDAQYIIVEGNVVDSARLQEMITDRINNANVINKSLSEQNAVLLRLVELGASNGKIDDDDLYKQAIGIFNDYTLFKEKIQKNRNNMKWTSGNKSLIEEVARLGNVEGDFNLTGKTNEQKVEKMLKKHKMSSLFVPYLNALWSDNIIRIKQAKEWSTQIPPRDLPYKKGPKRIKNPYNRKFCFVNNKKLLDTIDFNQQLKGWEWIYDEQCEETYTAYPRSIHYYKYKSHPEYRVIEDKVYNAEGNLVYQINLLRNDTEILRHLKEEMLRAIYINDFRSNKYDILKASAKTQEDIKNMLGLPFKSYVDSKTAKKNQKIINDYFGTQVEEIKASYGSRQQRERARVRANKAKMNMGAILLSGMADKDFNAAYNFKKQLEEDHSHDLYEIYKISRVSNTSFKVAFMNKDNKSSYTGLVKVKQIGKFQCDYEHKLIPNDESIEINPLDYPNY